MGRKTLVILAAGIGSRFGGGIKQLTPVDDDRHLIIDYSIQDAIVAKIRQTLSLKRRVYMKEMTGMTHESTWLEYKSCKIPSLF